MSAPARDRVGRAFSGAMAYDRHAHVQRIVAARLADRIATLDLPDGARILEIGCGTGFLSEQLIDRGIGSNWLLTDIAPGMIERCREKIGKREGVAYALLDAERDDPQDAGQFDLVCSSLAVQWFADPARSFRRMAGWAKPGGRCLFTTLGADTFREWRAAHEAAGLTAGTPQFRTAGEIAAILPDWQVHAPCVEPVVDRHEDGMRFLRSLRAIGANTPAAGHRPLNRADMARVIRNFERGGAGVTYEVVTCHYRRP